MGAVTAAAREIRTTLLDSQPYARLTLARRSFRFRGRDYRYFVHAYNRTWRTGRAVEIPIVWEEVQAHRGRRMLEVGNVLAHYFPVSHDRVDKYERGDGVRNVDIVDYQADAYDLIVCISTLEHVGFDEEAKEPEKFLRAIARLRSLLAPGGSFWATLPVGHNPHLDQALRERRVPFASQWCLQRVSADNIWREVEFAEIADSRLFHPFRGVNGLVVARFDPLPRASQGRAVTA